MKFIVRDHDNRGKYIANTQNLTDALKVFDEAKASGRRVELTAKNPGINRLTCIPDEMIQKARQRMNG